MQTLSDDERKACRDSFRAISAIEFLTKSPEFQTWLQGQREDIAKIEERILEDEMPMEEREKLRMERIGMLKVLNSPESDMESHVANLAAHGLTPGDSIDWLMQE